MKAFLCTTCTHVVSTHEVLFKCWEMHFFTVFPLPLEILTQLNLEGKSPVVEEAHKGLFLECSF